VKICAPGSGRPSSPAAAIRTALTADALERRPQLAAALAEAKRHKCSIVVAKLDRLSRDVHEQKMAMSICRLV
jgi:DNA invertase Pin-like site-specific DNA recombinase